MIFMSSLAKAAANMLIIHVVLLACELKLWEGHTCMLEYYRHLATQCQLSLWFTHIIHVST